jgi:preprotein translocase subunit YajC
MLKTVLLQVSGASDYSSLFLLGGIIIIFYFFMIRPQQKKQKDTRKFLEEVKKGDYIVTVGGIHGRISAIEGETLILDVEKGGKLKLEKSSISMEASKKYEKT